MIAFWLFFLSGVYGITNDTLITRATRPLIKTTCQLVNKTYTRCESKICETNYWLHFEVIVQGITTLACTSDSLKIQCDCLNYPLNQNQNQSEICISGSLDQYNKFVPGQSYDCMMDPDNQTSVYLMNPVVTDGSTQKNDSDNTNTIVLWILGVIFVLILGCVFCIAPDFFCIVFGVLGEIFACFLK